MDRYSIINEVGNGTFGNLWRAMNKQTGEVVAIKKMKRKYYSWEESINLREVKSLRKMSHSNIMKLKEVIREKDILYFVFEYMRSLIFLIELGKKLLRRKTKPPPYVHIKRTCQEKNVMQLFEQQYSKINQLQSEKGDLRHRLQGLSNHTKSDLNLAETNLGLNLDIADYCATASSEDDENATQ